MKNSYSLAQLNAIYCVYKDLNPDTHTIACVTCGKSIHINNPEQCFELYGHFIPRSVSRKLKYHPLNTHCQCSLCNLNETQQVKLKYQEYMKYRYGNNIEQELLNSEEKTEDYYKEFYIEELLKLSSKFPELVEILINTNTGELVNVTIDDNDYSNNIEKQFHTFSVTYKQDLDSITKILNTQPIEYERF